jgi:flagellar basal-body rod protein FlgC
MGPQEEIIQQEKYRYEYDPEHPDSDENGMVQYPDLDMVEEMTNMVSANRLYEANLAVVEAEKQVIKRSFEI